LKDSKVHLKKFSNDKVEKLLFGQKPNSNEYVMGFDKFGASTSHVASNFKRKTISLLSL